MKTTLGIPFKETQDGGLIYVGSDPLITRISTRFKRYGALIVESPLTTVAMLQVIYKGMTSRIAFPGLITMHPSHMEFVTDSDDGEYLECTFNKGDVWVSSNKYVPDPQIAGMLFREIVYLGKTPYHMEDYDIIDLFREISHHCDINFGIGPSDLAMLITTIIRNGTLLGIRSVAQVANTVADQINGSYESDGIDAALVNAASTNKASSDLEQMARS